jgi:hypothetical protein
MSHLAAFVVLALAPVLSLGPVAPTPVPDGAAPGHSPHRAVRSGGEALDGSPVGRAPLEPRLRRPDGAGLHRTFADPVPLAHGRYFPVAVWFEGVYSQGDVDLDRAAGLNTYLEVTNPSDLDLIRANGMHVVAASTDPRLSGYLLPDEVDMWAGPGSADWTGRWPGQGDVCSPAHEPCGYTVLDTLMREVPDDTMVYGQFGKGVTFWETRAQATRFVNQHPDVVSADNYWFTDPNICGEYEGGSLFGVQRDLRPGECRRGANYGRTVEYVRSLVVPRGSKPVWVFVEVGHPAGEDWAPTIRAHQIRDAVWSGLVHGARGVVYFNHSFGGDCLSQHVLRDPCGAEVRPTVTRLNRRIARLAPLLNAPHADGVVAAPDAVDVDVRLWRGSFHVLVSRPGNRSARANLSVACGKPKRAVALGPGRDRTVRGGAFSVRVPATSSVRIYRLEGGTTCGLG